MKKLLTLLALLTSTLSINAQEDIPAPIKPYRFVNDFTGNTLNPQENNALNQKLVHYYNQTSTQIAVVIVKDLAGYDKADYAYQIGEKWGIRDKKRNINNGIVILIKPKYGNSRGEAFIATGYDIEGLVPDAIANRIIETEMIPHFKNNNYYAGIHTATNTLIALTEGEFTAAQWSDKNPKRALPPFIFIILILMIIVSMFGKARNTRNHNVGSSNLPFWLALTMFGSGRRGGGYSSFSSGSGSFGGFGGGGGGFGGGGAGGSW